MATSYKKDVKMVKKLTILLAVCFGVLMVIGGAMAVPYPLQFDPDATGDTYSSEIAWGWDMEAVPKEIVPKPNLNQDGDPIGPIYGTGTGQPVSFVTHQQLGTDGKLGEGDTFYENITVRLLNGLLYNGADYEDLVQNYKGFINSDGDVLVPPANLYIDLSLTGFITGYSDGGTETVATNPSTIQDDQFTSIFSTGTARLYVDSDDDHTYTSNPMAETTVALFELNSAGPFILTPSVFGGAGAQISFGFKTIEINPDYFSNAPGYPNFIDSVNSGFHITLTQGGVAALGDQIAGDTSTSPDEILLGWQETGFDAKFEVVPEPSTMFLMGSGLLGVAFFARRKFFKKG